MVLTNAERQARYRASLKRKASLVGLGERANEAVNLAVAALWSCAQRGESADFAGAPEGEDLPALREWIGGDLVRWCEAYLLSPEDLTAEELQALRTVVEIDAAIRPRKADKQRKDKTAN